MAAQDIRICFIGDSFVNGTGDENFLGWTGRLCIAANKNNFSLTAYNLGIRRNTSTDILARWEQECESCDGRVVLSCGVNDMVLEEGHTRVTAEVSLRNVKDILQQASAKYTTLLIGPPPSGNAELNHRIRNISASYAQLASSLSIPFIDIFSQLISDPTYLLENGNNDGYHPMSHGYTAITNIILASEHWWFKQV
jgi:acyl-CoA thioesterase-1